MFSRQPNLWGILIMSAIGSFGHARCLAENVPAREPEATFPCPNTHTIGRILFTPDGTQLVGFGKDRTTRQGIIDFWDLKTQKLVRTLTHPDEVAALAFTADGQRLVTAAWDNRLRILRVATGKMEHEFEHDPRKQTANHLAVLPDGQRFVSGNVGFSGPRIWSMKNRTAAALGGQHEQVTALAVGSDGKRLAVAYSAPVIEIWSADKLEAQGQLRKEGRVFVGAALSPNGEHIATGLIGPLEVILWDGASLKERVTCPGVVDVPKALTFTPDSKFLVGTMGAERDVLAKVCIWDVASGKLAYAFSPYKHGCMRQALSPDGRWLVTCGVDCTLRLWDFDKIRREIGKK
ncbi:MAG: hypothetical protein JNM56_07230 [Planctomycetia bacterium]|nr:hypothetical protein [Planctomycetia bacterium]